MKSILTVLALLLIGTTIYAQDDMQSANAAIVDQGVKLYRSEMASWHGTDLFLAVCKNKQPLIGGYFSYTENNISRCIFFSKAASPVVIGSISFDSTYNISSARIDTVARNFTPAERDLYTIRQKTLSLMSTDSMFVTYKNTNFNLIPFIGNNERKVYVLTCPTKAGVVVLGNDYLIHFNGNNELIGKRKLHKDITVIQYSNEDPGDTVTFHAHGDDTGPLITATDVCTLLLYGKIAGWKQHIVASDTYVSIWDCTKNGLVTLTKKAWDAIYSEVAKQRQNEK